VPPKLPPSLGDPGHRLIYGSSGHPNPQLERHFGRFIRFCRDHDRVQQTDHAQKDHATSVAIVDFLTFDVFWSATDKTVLTPISREKRRTEHDVIRADMRDDGQW